MDLGLEGRVAVVTGGAAGIGAAIAENLAAEGCIVWIADRNAEQAQRTTAALMSKGLRVYSLVVDVRCAEVIALAFRRVVEETGRLDILVCNAGILHSGSFLDSSTADWERVVAVNLSGVVNCIRAAAKVMTAQGGGRIVNIASVAAMRGGGSIGNTLYGTTKAGVIALTMGLARELGSAGITVNAVAPAVADTPMTRTALTDDSRNRIISRVPLGRLATPTDVANAVTFLASDRASFVSGAVLPVDGGILTT